MKQKKPTKQCDHKSGLVRLEKDSCGCRRIKCYVCSMEVRFGCLGHGTGTRILNAGRK